MSGWRALGVGCVIGTACAQQPVLNERSTIPLSACELGRYADFVGRFELVSRQRAVGSDGLVEATLSLREALIARRPNDVRVSPRRASSGFARRPQAAR